MVPAREAAEAEQGTGCRMAYWLVRRVPAMPKIREEMHQQQLRSLRALLRHVWRHSTFYRDYYASHGITERDLLDLEVRDLPFLSKARLMDHFDGAVTDSRLHWLDIERWLRDDHDPAEYYQQHFVVVHGSGSSGRYGIFAYSRADWQVMNSTIAPRLPLPERSEGGKTRAAFYMARHGHFAGITTARHVPTATYDVLFLSVLDDTAAVVESLNAFQPHRLTGYASSISTLATLAHEGALRIRPRTVLVSGDLLTEPMARSIRGAWDAPIHVTYSASESPYMAVQFPADDEMTVMDDLNILEVLDEADRPVAAGEQGRVVVTNLFNYTLPIIRYELGDRVTRGTVPPSSAFTSIRGVHGRADDALPVLRDDGETDALHPPLLGALSAPGLERIQFISERPDHVRLDYVGPDGIGQELRRVFQGWLTLKGAARTTFRVCRVPHIPIDPRTGKSELLLRDWERAPRSTAGARAGPGPRPVAPRRAAPATPFVPFPAVDVEQSIPARFEQQVQRSADRLAVRTPHHELTYAALNRAANRLARALIAIAGETAEPVTLLFEHGAPMLVGLLGILKAGKFFVALDPTYPRNRLAAMLADTESRLLISDTPSWSLARQLARPGGQVLNVEALDPALSPDDLARPLAPDSLAYILYTSGTTGQPKGVIHDHRGLLHTIMKYTNGSHIRAEDRLTLLFSYSFGAAMTNIFGALLNGAALLPYDLKKQPIAELATRMHRDGITVYHSVPTVFRHFVDTFTGGETFPALRLIELAGEPVTLREVERYRRHFGPDCLLHNRMGVTEMGIVRQYFLDHETALSGPTVPVGYPVADTEVLLLDDRGEEVGGHDVGEMTIRSRYLFRGYWRQAELTTATLLADPAGSGARLYRTGDLGRLRHDGCLLYLGRKDARVKLRGYLVDPAEVEGVLLRHAAVKDAVVIVREDRPESPLLVAYVVSAGAPAPTTRALRRFMQEHLPTHMVPASVVLLEALPLLPNGKLDRRALPAPTHDAAARSQPPLAPRTPYEQGLARIWADVLGCEPVSVDDDFFEVGGDSLRATQFLGRVLDRFRVDVPLRLFFEAPTVAHLAVAVAQLTAEGAQNADVTRLLTEMERGDGGAS
jgi:amino acid adenylation domain-containing protein